MPNRRTLIPSPQQLATAGMRKEDFGDALRMLLGYFETFGGAFNWPTLDSFVVTYHKTYDLL